MSNPGWGGHTTPQERTKNRRRAIILDYAGSGAGEYWTLGSQCDHPGCEHPATRYEFVVLDVPLRVGGDRELLGGGRKTCAQHASSKARIVRYPDDLYRLLEQENCLPEGYEP